MGHAITANPASGVTADSAATALTVVYRDTNAATALGATTFSGKINPFSQTIAQLRLIVPAAGDSYFCSNCTGAVGATGKIVVATGTSAGNFADAAGGAFK